jgi:hypothetical protein
VGAGGASTTAFGGSVVGAAGGGGGATVTAGAAPYSGLSGIVRFAGISVAGGTEPVAALDDCVAGS